jgi:hypothetical protein
MPARKSKAANAAKAATAETKKWLRGDPDRPFPTDLDALNKLVAETVFPTHEPIWFYRNRGSASPREKHRAMNYQAVQNVEKMHRLGLHIPRRAHFFKGFGLARERPYIEKTIAYAKELHKRGMLVSVYIGGTLFTDYFFKEVPKAIHWARKDQSGNGVTYGGWQLMRWFPCLNNPGYRAYTKKVLDIAVQEIEADEIFFDNQILRHEPRSCRCEHCVKHLREMIRRKYTLKQCEERYGLAEYPDVVPPIWSQACPPWRLDRIQSPQIQDWIDHRIASVVEFYQDMANHVKKQKRDCVVGMNIKGVHGHNRAFDHGICHGAFADILDFSCIDGYDPGARNGAIVTEVRFWKSSHSTHIAVIDGYGTELAAAEGQVYGHRKFVKGHGWLNDLGECELFTPMLQFLRGHQRLYTDRTHLHDVAVLRSEPSTNYNCAKVHEQLIAFEQTLAVEKIPWGIIYDRQIKDLAKYRIIALPEIQALSDKWIDALDRFLKAGGGVIASGKAASYNEWCRSRDPDHALARWLGHAPHGQYEVAHVGKGRFVYVPDWDVQTPWDFHDWFSIWGENVLPVRNRDVFLKAIDDATVGRPLTHRVTGNDFVFVEAIAAADGADRGVDLHFINYNEQDTAPAMNVRVALPAGKRRAKVSLTDPHQPDHPSWEIGCAIQTHQAAFAVPTPKVYLLAQVTFA